MLGGVAAVVVAVEDESTSVVRIADTKEGRTTSRREMLGRTSRREIIIVLRSDERKLFLDM